MPCILDVAGYESVLKQKKTHSIYCMLHVHNNSHMMSLIRNKTEASKKKSNV